jgi:hypothetical protein
VGLVVRAPKFEPSSFVVRKVCVRGQLVRATQFEPEP